MTLLEIGTMERPIATHVTSRRKTPTGKLARRGATLLPRKRTKGSSTRDSGPQASPPRRRTMMWQPSVQAAGSGEPLLTRRASRHKQHTNRVIMARKFIAESMAAQAQKSERPWTGTVDARLNATTLQRDVSETPTPARPRTSAMTSDVLCCWRKGTPSSEKLRVRTSMSFTPRPMARKGMPLMMALLRRKPSKKKRPAADTVAKATTPRPCCPKLLRLAKGEVQLAMLRETNKFMSTALAMIKGHSGLSNSVSSVLRKSVCRLADSISGDAVLNVSTA
mmetsp:Transcript_30574/g.82784  ORF Transcript_30574/g.82784 Transcript_30574/m.82784 type:complete len:279 (-) Transcript_30574:773-1609(-)